MDDDGGLHVINFNDVIRTVRKAVILNRPKVFILSLPHSGSSVLGEIFKQNPSFKYLYEPSHNGWLEVNACVWDETTNKPKAARLWQELYFNCSTRNIAYRSNQFWPPHPQYYYWTKNYDQTERDCHNNVIVVKEVAIWWSKIKWLYSVLGPRARFIFLVTDPRHWVASLTTHTPTTKEKNNNKNEKRASSLYEEFGYHNRSLMVKCSGAPLTQDFKNLKDLLEDTDAAPHMRLAALWKAHNQEVYDQLMSIPVDNRLIIDVEQFLLDPHRHVGSIYSFIDMHVPDRVTQWISKNMKDGDQGVWKESLSDQEITYIEEITLDLYNSFNDDTAHKLL
eukprot:TRINITY_DN6357_c1_g2_i1.p1 TRINITY_DN6357_c1_g2~~TRINITY_DN6357_c1_g2_i1.p1  ORF type:complete len:377 (+),score=75.87 TRINITY_DN6357_c1_g2_i1:124-1131(+)